MLFSALAVIAVALTVAMFAIKERMLGFPCVIFWAVLGAYAWGEVVTAWIDIWFYMFFACFGMVIFTAIAQYGLREKLDAIGDEDMEEGEGGFIGEGEPEMGDGVKSAGEEPLTARERIRKRREERQDRSMGRYRR